jgi:hypothetical protein
LLCAVLLVLAPPLAGQSRPRLRAATPIFAGADGTRLGTFQAGVAPVAGKVQGGWREVTLEGWLWSASTGPATRPGFTLSVTAAEGENLRTRPDGDLVARLTSGAQLGLVEKKGAWVHVRRTVWVAASSFDAAPSASAPSSLPPTSGAQKPAPALSPDQSAAPPRVSAPQPADTFQHVMIRKGAELTIGSGGAVIGATPEQVPGWITSRSGNWVRVRTDVWVRGEDVRASADSASITLERLRAEPDRYVGETVIWRLQYLSVQTADELRPEMPSGQPYLLARGPLPEAGFVYVIVSPEQAARFKRLNPLDEFTANAVIRASRTRYLPTPVIELRGLP